MVCLRCSVKTKMEDLFDDLYEDFVQNVYKYHLYKHGQDEINPLFLIISENEMFKKINRQSVGRSNFAELDNLLLGVMFLVRQDCLPWYDY